MSVSAYMGETPSSDNAVWLMGEKQPDGSRAPGIAQKSIQALREVGVLLMSESTSDRLFRQIADTWLGSAEDDPLDDYDRYASREEARNTLNNACVDQLEDDRHLA